MDRAPAKVKRGTRRAKARPSHVPDGGLRIGRSNIILLGLAVAAIGIGFISLAMGSTTLSAILLVGGYLGLVPWAILAKGRPDSKPANDM